MADKQAHGWRNAKPYGDRGYGWQHKRERARWIPIVAMGRTACWRCQLLIKPSDAWHLGHNDDRTGYMGPEHKDCNIGAASRRAHEIRNNVNPLPIPETRWD